MNSLVNIPNALSFLRIAITPIFVWILLFQPAYLCFGIMLFTLAALTDTCDGYVARRYGLVTEFGNFLDPFADKVLVFSTFFSFYFLGYVPLWFVLIVVFRDTMITFLRLVLVNKNRSLRTSSLGKWKTTMQIMLVYAVFLQMIFGNTMPFIAWSICVFIYLVALMTIVSGIDYLRSIVRS